MDSRLGRRIAHRMCFVWKFHMESFNWFSNRRNLFLSNRLNCKLLTKQNRASTNKKWRVNRQQMAVLLRPCMQKKLKQYDCFWKQEHGQSTNLNWFLVKWTKITMAVCQRKNLNFWYNWQSGATKNSVIRWMCILMLCGLICFKLATTNTVMGKLTRQLRQNGCLIKKVKSELRWVSGVEPAAVFR